MPVCSNEVKLFVHQKLRVAYGMSEVIHGLSFDVAKKENAGSDGARNGMGKDNLFQSR